MEVINYLMANPVASAGPARAPTGVIRPQAADNVMPAALEPAALAVLIYENRHCRDCLPTTAYGSHANGWQHVRCRAYNISISH